MAAASRGRPWWQRPAATNQNLHLSPTKPWGHTCAFVRDKDGITVELCSPATQTPQQ